MSRAQLRHCVGAARATVSTYSDAQVANRNVRDFRSEIAHGAVSRRPPISLYTMVPRTAGYTYDVGVCDFSIVQGRILCRAVPNLN